MARFRLTPSLVERICSYIRVGAYPAEAAEAAGVPKEIFQCWMRRSGRRRRGPLALLGPAVYEAMATARIYAETSVFRGDPLAWLKHGPGKEGTDRPGWSALVRAHAAQEGQAADDLLNPMFQEHFATILQALAPFPEARVAVAAALADPPPEVPTDTPPVDAT
jgi:hypothetical protein